MEETEILIEALWQVPELVEAAKTYKESNEKTISIMSTAIKKRPKALIPQKEVDKVTEAVGATKINLQHEHTHRHYSYSASFDMINDTAKKWIIGLGISVVVLCGIIAYGIHYMRTSELFLGKRCMDIYMSDYVTEKEKKEMLKDCYWISFYPKKYQDSPQALRERIRKNEAIIDKREWESRIRKGKFKTDKMVGF